MSPDAPGPVAGVLFVCEGPVEDARPWLSRLAAEGYAVLAPELRAPADDRRAVVELVAALGHLAARPEVCAERLAALGLGRGGTLAYLLACKSPLLAAVADLGGSLFHPALSAERPIQPLELALNLDAPFLGVFAGSDPAAPPEQIAALRRTLDQFARPAEIHVLAEAAAGFLAQPPDADGPARRAWELARDFLRAQLALEADGAGAG